MWRDGLKSDKWAERVNKEVQRSLIVIELDVVRDDAQAANSRERSILSNLSSQVDMRVWHCRMHLNVIEALLHVPFVLRVADFFSAPLAAMPPEAMPTDTMEDDALPTMLGGCHWRLECILSQIDLILINHTQVRNLIISRHLPIPPPLPLTFAGLFDLRRPSPNSNDLCRPPLTFADLPIFINHTQGPNMPLLRVSLRDVFVLGVHRTEQVLQFDVQVPVEVAAYNAETNDFESLIEPLVVCNRLKLSQGAQLFKGGDIFVRVHSSVYNETTVHCAASPINITITQLTLANLIKFVPSVLALMEEMSPPAPPADDAKHANGSPINPPRPGALMLRASMRSSAAAGMAGAATPTCAAADAPGAGDAYLHKPFEEVRTPYMVHNSLGVDVTVSLDSDTSQDKRLPVANGEKRALLFDGVGETIPVAKAAGGGGSQYMQYMQAIDSDAGRGLLTAHVVDIESRRFRARMRAVQVDQIGHTIQRVPFPLSDNPGHEARIVCDVSVLNEQVGSSNILRLETMLRVRNDTRHSMFITMYAVDDQRKEEGGGAPSSQPDVEDDATLAVDQGATESRLRPPGADAEDIEIRSGEMHCLPLHLAHLSHLSVRPARTYARSSPRIISELANLGSSCHVRCEATQSDPDYSPIKPADPAHGKLRRATVQVQRAARRLLPGEALNATVRKAARAEVANQGGRTQAPQLFRPGASRPAAATTAVPCMNYVLTLEKTVHNVRGQAASARDGGDEDEAEVVDTRRRHEDTQYTVVISPPVIVENLLACPMKFTLVDRSSSQVCSLAPYCVLLPPLASSSSSRFLSPPDAA